MTDDRTQSQQAQTVAELADAAALGELVREGDRSGLRYVRRYPHPVDRVWRAITDSDQLRYWMPCDIVGERAAGAAITLPFWPAHVEKYGIDEPALSGRIEIWEPPRRFAWTWGGDLLIFELSGVDDGTELVFTTWPEDSDLAGIVSTAGGYHICLAELAVLLDDGSAPAMTEVDTIAFRLETTYRERFGTS